MLRKFSLVALSCLLLPNTVDNCANLVDARADRAVSINDKHFDRYLKYPKEGERGRNKERGDISAHVAETRAKRKNGRKEEAENVDVTTISKKTHKFEQRREKADKAKERRDRKANKKAARRENRRKRNKDFAEAETTSRTCPNVLGESVEIDYGAVLYYALVPSDPPRSGNGILCGRLVAEGEGWVGLAVSKNGGMVGSEAVIGVPGDGTVLKYEMTGKSMEGVTPMSSGKQTLKDTSIELRNGKTIMEFTKLLVEDGEIPILEEGINTFLHARGGDSLGYHRSRLSFAMDFADDLAW